MLSETTISQQNHRTVKITLEVAWLPLLFCEEQSIHIYQTSTTQEKILSIPHMPMAR
jgi:hypothetical protein